MPAQRCAVLGKPIGHSLSPVLHRAAYDVLGLDWSYEAIEVGESDLEPFLSGLGDEWRGLSLTMPLKRTVIPLSDALDDWTRVSGVANTLVFQDGRRDAHNTDIPGAVAAVRSRTALPVTRAVVLGGGATATSILLALAELGCGEARILVRDPARAQETVDVVDRATDLALSVGSLGESVEADILVSTIPASAQTAVLGRVTAPVVFEALYEPWPTPLAEWATSSGAVLIGGLDLLVQQAALQVALMTGSTVDADVLWKAGQRALSGA